MATVATVVAKFEADTKDLQAGAARVNSSLRSVDDGVRKSALSMGALKAGFLAAGAAAGMFALKVGIDAVTAAAEEEQAVAKLGTALKNVGQEFRLSEVEAFVDDLQRATGVADDDLRPALQSLVTATGDVTQAQDLLGIALDISTATGRDLTSVSIALAKASNGQFMQINRLTNGALNPAVLATKDLAQVTGALDELYGGAAQANADTYAGKIKILKIAYDELLEAFGAGFIDGITEGADATKDMGEAFRAAEPGMQEFGRTVGELGRILSYVSPFFDDVVNTFKVAIPSALAATVAAFPPAAGLVAFIGTTFMGSKASVDAYTASADRAANSMSGTVLAALDTTATGIKGVGDAAEEAAEELAAMKAEMDVFLASIGAISAVDKAAESIDNLGAASVEFGTNLMGQTPRARDFRAEVVDAFEASAKAAQSLSDDLPTQRAIFTGELIKIVASLRASGVKDSDIEAFLGAMEGLPASVADIMRSAAKAVGDTDFKTEIEKAFKKSVKNGTPMTADTMEQLATGASKAAKEKLGLTLEPELASVIKSGTTALRPTAFLNGQLTGKSIGSGVANGISESSPIVQAAIARVIAQAKAAADAAAKAQSPSRLFAETGDDMAAGVAMGWTRSAPRIYSAVAAAAPRAKEEGSKLAKALAAGFRESVGSGFASAINDIFGSIPAEKSPLEAILGTEGTEKYIKNNTKALQALAALGAAFDMIAEKVSFAASAITALAESTARPFGRPSDLMEIFGSGSDIDRVIDGYLNLAQTITDSFSVLTDASIVGDKAAKANRANLRGILKSLEGLTRQAIALREEYEANLEALAQAEKDYAEDVKAINARYDELDKEAAANIKAIENRWAAVIPGLESAAANARAVYERENTALQSLISERDGFLKQIADGARSFLNNLSFTKRKAEVAARQSVPEKQIIETVQELANGIRVITKREITPAAEAIAEAVEEPLSAVDIRSSLEARLADLRAFSQNIRTLVARGLDPALVKEFVSAGVSGAGEAAAALAAGSADEISAINSVQNALASEVAQFGQYAADEWHNAAIAQQEAVVGAALTQQQIAERALAQATAMRDRELKAAQDFAQTLKDQRQADLVQREAEYEAEKARLEARNRELQTQMDAIAQLIQNFVSRLASRLPQQTEDAGQDAARKLLNGFRKAYPQVFQQLNRLMDELARSMNRTVTVTVRTVYEATGSLPARAMGGPVQARTAYLVGERGPEVFVPYGNGNIIPNHALGAVPSMGSRSGGGGTAIININVNAGMGADGAEIGRHIVDSLRQYERRNGPIPVSVTG